MIFFDWKLNDENSIGNTAVVLFNNDDMLSWNKIKNNEEGTLIPLYTNSAISNKDHYIKNIDKIHLILKIADFVGATDVVYKYNFGDKADTKNESYTHINLIDEIIIDKTTLKSAVLNVWLYKIET
jgi:hypothetical protein